MQKPQEHAALEALKFVVRVTILVGVPAILTALITAKPQWGLGIGIALAAVDKYIHKLPNEYQGLLPF
jgi:hypothetical protein